MKITGVHPLADLFPMLDDRELKALAADIKANGLREPIKVTADGILVEGRNRLKACELVKVKPDFETVDGDAGDLIVSANIMRRHMTKGQIAILAVVAELGIELERDSAERARSSSARSASSNSGSRQYDYRRQAHRRVQDLVSKRLIDDAIFIVDWAPDQARVILDTGLGMKYGLELGAQRKREATSEENRRRIMAEDSPELLAQVNDEEGGFTLDEAWRIREDRITQEREKASRMTNYLVSCVSPLLQKTDFGTVEMVEYYDPKFARREITIADLDEAIAQLQLIRREMKRLKKGI